MLGEPRAGFGVEGAIEPEVPRPLLQPEVSFLLLCCLLEAGLVRCVPTTEVLGGQVSVSQMSSVAHPLNVKSSCDCLRLSNVPYVFSSLAHSLSQGVQSSAQGAPFRRSPFSPQRLAPSLLAERAVPPKISLSDASL